MTWKIFRFIDYFIRNFETTVYVVNYRREVRSQVIEEMQ